MDRIYIYMYIPDHNHIFRKLSRMSSGDFPRLPGLKYDDIIRKMGRRITEQIVFFIDRDPRGSIGAPPGNIFRGNMVSVTLI